MTAARQQRNPSLILALAGGLGWGGVLTPLAAAHDIAVNPKTGLAISGFVPMSYFVDHNALMGKPELELNLYGTIWQSRNPGNRAAFAADPDV